MLALWHSAVLALALTLTPLAPSRCGGVTMAAHTIRGSFQALRRKVKGTFSSEQMDAITNVEQFAESKVQIAESKVQIAEEQKRSARKEVKLLEEKEELLEANIAFMAKDRRTLLLALARYRCVLENRALLEANAQALYKTESLISTNAQVQKLINEKARSSRV